HEPVVDAQLRRAYRVRAAPKECREQRTRENGSGICQDAVSILPKVGTAFVRIFVADRDDIDFAAILAVLVSKETLVIPGVAREKAIGHSQLIGIGRP